MAMIALCFSSAMSAIMSGISGETSALVAVRTIRETARRLVPGT